MEDFTIPFGRTPAAHLSAVFSSTAFQNYAPPDPEPAPVEVAPNPLTPEEMNWVNETIENGQPISPAPSRAAEKYLRTEFKRYDFPMPVTEAQWKNFVLMKWYTMANDPDPKVAKSALDSIAKSSAANLMVEKKEINITSRSDEELNHELKELFRSLRAKTTERVIEGTVERV
jgi:hypothetical protein